MAENTRTARIQQALAVLRDVGLTTDWTPCRAQPTPPWDDPHHIRHLGYTRIAAAFVDAGWTPPEDTTPPHQPEGPGPWESSTAPPPPPT